MASAADVGVEVDVDVDVDVDADAQEQRPYKVVIYRNRIYALSKEYTYTSTSYYEGTEYYTYTHNLGRHTFQKAFDVDFETCEFRAYSVGNAASCADLFSDYMDTVVDISEKTDGEIDAIHSALLADTIRKQRSNQPTQVERADREAQHRSIYMDDIQTTLQKISERVYDAASKGETTIKVEFSVDEYDLTRRGKLPRFEKAPCADGVERPRFYEYALYLLFEVYGSPPGDLSACKWITQKLSEKVQEVFPHFRITPTGVVFPELLIQFAVADDEVDP